MTAPPETVPSVLACRGIMDRIQQAAAAHGRKAGDICLVAVSKTHDAEAIEPVLAAGHRVFGENRVQEAKAKWPALRQKYPDLKLHLIGPLQSNKAAEAVALFDAIESIDRDKIAAAISAEMKRQHRTPELFVQVNIGDEPQKAGIAADELPAFLERLKSVHRLKVSGLMCIPPADEAPKPYFRKLAGLAKKAGLSMISMGMSGDFEEAIAEGTTHVRVGSAIFGARG